jgi:peptidoglycan-associated lipoprotein
VNRNSREWMWLVSGFSLLLLVGCSEEQKSTSMKTDPPKVSINVSTVKGSFVDNDHLKPVYFDLHRSKLSDEGKTIVADNAAWIKTQPPFLLEIIGVADQRGSASRNKTLAERRALSVKAEYVALGITPDRIQIMSLGENSQSCTDMTEECFQISRRADTKIEDKALLAQR